MVQASPLENNTKHLKVEDFRLDYIYIERTHLEV